MLSLFAQHLECTSAGLGGYNDAHIPVSDFIPSAAVNGVEDDIVSAEDVEIHAVNNTTDQLQRFEPSAKKNLLSDFDVTSMQPPASSGSHRKAMTLPTKISSTNCDVPLVASAVRSPRLHREDGFLHCQLKASPRKRIKSIHKEDQALPSYLHFLEEAPTNKREISSPIPIEVLKNWGIDCGISSEMISEEALLKSPSNERCKQRVI